VNRNALPSPDARRSETAGTFILPRNPLEETLADIWTELLGLEQVGIHDNFFDLGGDSILAIQIISRANQAGLRLTPKQLFQNQTIAGLAAISGVMAEISSSVAEQPADNHETRSAFSQKELAYVIEELTRSEGRLHEPEGD
jgi:aryl carrier-like protein